jgi:hypothetical protein
MDSGKAWALQKAIPRRTLDEKAMKTSAFDVQRAVERTIAWQTLD